MNHNTIPTSPLNQSGELPPVNPFEEPNEPRLSDERIKLNAAVHAVETGDDTAIATLSEDDQRFYKDVAHREIQANRQALIDQFQQSEAYKIPGLNAAEATPADGIDRTDTKSEKSRFKKIAKGIGARISRLSGIKVNRKEVASSDTAKDAQPINPFTGEPHTEQTDAAELPPINPFEESQEPRLSDERIKLNAAVHAVETGDDAAIASLSSEEQRFYKEAAQTEIRAKRQ